MLSAPKKRRNAVCFTVLRLQQVSITERDMDRRQGGFVVHRWVQDPTFDYVVFAQQPLRTLLIEVASILKFIARSVWLND